MRAPAGLYNVPGSQVKNLEEGQTLPSPPECTAKMPPATLTTLGGHIPSFCCCFPAKKLPQSEQEPPDPHGHRAAPRHPLTLQPPHQKETKQSGRGFD